MVNLSSLSSPFQDIKNNSHSAQGGSPHVIISFKKKNHRDVRLKRYNVDLPNGTVHERRFRARVDTERAPVQNDDDGKRAEWPQASIS